MVWPKGNHSIPISIKLTQRLVFVCRGNTLKVNYRRLPTDVSRQLYIVPLACLTSDRGGLLRDKTRIKLTKTLARVEAVSCSLMRHGCGAAPYSCRCAVAAKVIIHLSPALRGHTDWQTCAETPARVEAGESQNQQNLNVCRGAAVVPDGVLSGNQDLV